MIPKSLPLRSITVIKMQGEAVEQCIFAEFPNLRPPVSAVQELRQTHVNSNEVFQRFAHFETFYV